MTPTYHTSIAHGSSEWLALRAGLPSASEFKKIITAKTKKLSDSRFPYMNRLLAERMLGMPLSDTYESGDMIRGKDLEPEAIAWYEMERGCDIEEVAWISVEYELPLRGRVRYGCSPDGVTNQRTKGIEFKVKNPANHVGHLAHSLGWPGKAVDEEHAQQVNGQLLVTDWQSVDVVAYHSKLPNVIIEVTRDEEYIAKLKTAVEDFSLELEQRWMAVQSLYPDQFIWPRKTAVAEPANYQEFLTQEDADAILADLKQKGAFASVTQD